MLVTLSRSSPPYSAGASIMRSPASPALRISAAAAAMSWASSACMAGITSAFTNCSAVTPMLRCSSVKSSGTKTSSAAASVIRNSAPLKSFFAMVPSS